MLQRDMVTLCYQFTDVTGRTVRVDGALFIQQSMDGLPVAENNNIRRTKLERKYRAIFFRPLQKSVRLLMKGKRGPAAYSTNFAYRPLEGIW